MAGDPLVPFYSYEGSLPQGVIRISEGARKLIGARFEYICTVPRQPPALQEDEVVKNLRKFRRGAGSGI